MRAAAAAALTPPDVPRRALLACAALGLVLLAAFAADTRPAWVLGATTAVLGLWASYRYLTRWPVMIGAIILCILLVPIARYGLPVTLPFQLEPYRLLVAIVGILWFASLLAEPATLRVEKSGLRGPMLCVMFAIAGSVVANLSSIHARGLDTDVVLKLSFLASFFLVAIMLGSVLRTRAELDGVIKVLVAGGAAVSLMTLIENKTGFNAFDHLHQVFPALVFDPGGSPSDLQVRGSGFRVYGSAQHPLALGAALVTLIPAGIYVGFRTHSRWWWGAVALIGIAALATVARTAVMMLVVEVIALACLKPAAFKRIWWAIPPFLIVVNLAVPATLGTLKASFFPEGGLIAQQQTDAGGDAGNRLSDVGPGLQESKRTPFFGQGWGTRVPEKLDPAKTRRILDNQWLGLLLEAGWVGILAFAWFFARNVRLLAGAALRDPTDLGWLLAGLAASILAFAVGMFTYDAFAFTQATLLMFIMVGLGIAARRLPREPGPPPQPA